MHCLDSGQCQTLNSHSNPSNTGKWQASITKKNKNHIDSVASEILPSLIVLINYTLGRFFRKEPK